MAPTEKSPNPRSKRPAPPAPLTCCTVNTRCNPARFSNFWRNTCLRGLTLDHHRLIAVWPFRHALDLPDMKLQRPFILEILRLWDTKMNGFNVNGTIIQPTDQDIAGLLCLHASGLPVDVHPRKGGEIKSKVAKRFFNTSTITINQLKTTLRHELLLKNRVATPEEWMSIFTMFYFATTLFAQSKLNIPMQFWDYVDDLPKLREYQWGVAAYDFLNRQLPEIGYKAHQDQPSKPCFVGCSFVLLSWFYEWANPPTLRRGTELFPRYNNWDFCIDATKSSFLTILKDVDINAPKGALLPLLPNEKWVLEPSLDDVIAGYEKHLPYIDSSAYRASQLEPLDLPSPLKTSTEPKRKRIAGSTPPFDRQTRSVTLKKIEPRQSSGFLFFITCHSDLPESRTQKEGWICASPTRA